MRIKDYGALEFYFEGNTIQLNRSTVSLLNKPIDMRYWQFRVRDISMRVGIGIDRFSENNYIVSSIIYDAEGYVAHIDPSSMHTVSGETYSQLIVRAAWNASEFSGSLFKPSITLLAVLTINLVDQSRSSAVIH